MIQHRPYNMFSSLYLESSENVLRTSWNCLPGTSLGRQIRTSPTRLFEMSLGCSNKIFRGRPGNVGGGRPQDVLGTNICRLGSFRSFTVFTVMYNSLQEKIDIERLVLEYFVFSDKKLNGKTKQCSSIEGSVLSGQKLGRYNFKLLMRKSA